MKNLQIISGIIIHGAGRGRDLGYPTANLDTPAEQLPQGGVYAVYARIEGESQWRTGAANVGSNPTFENDGVRMEVHILDFNGWIYGKRLEVVVVRRMRSEKTYAGVEALIAQLEKDCVQAREILKSRQVRAVN